MLALTRLSTTLDTLPVDPPAPSTRGPPRSPSSTCDKTFRLPHRRYSTLKERALHPFSARSYDELRAVDDISFTVREGEFFGIVGRNGSGKSTLLKCLAGIYNADEGTVDIEGRLSPFIELGVGFNPDLTARDNVRAQRDHARPDAQAGAARASTTSSPSPSSRSSSTSR